MCVEDKPITYVAVTHTPSTEYEQFVVTDGAEDRLGALFNLLRYKDLLPMCLFSCRKSKNFDMTTHGPNFETTENVQF